MNNNFNKRNAIDNIVADICRNKGEQLILNI